MKKTILAFSMLLLSPPAFAAESVTKIDVRCTPPDRLAGGSAYVRGTLTLSTHPTYPAPAKKAEGVLLVDINGSSRNVKVMGQYDQINGLEYAHVGSLPDGKLSIFLDLNHKDRSYVEFQGQAYLMNCVD